MHVAELWRYPVKSMAGECLEAAEMLVTGIPHDRSLYVVDGFGEILSARTKPLLLGHHATVDGHGAVLVDGLPWESPEVASAVERAAGAGARLARASGPERFDILPLLVATDGAIHAFGYDGRRLRPNVVLAGVSGLDERSWQGRQISIGDVVVGVADLRALHHDDLGSGHADAGHRRLTSHPGCFRRHPGSRRVGRPGWHDPRRRRGEPP